MPDPTETPATANGSPAPIPGLLMDGGEYMPALTLGGALPKERNGMPLFHYHKESLKPGTFTDARGKAWTVTPDDIDSALADAQRALAMGHEPTIQDDHFKPQRSFGFVTGARKNARGGLDLLHSFMGERNRDDALTRKTSICLLPNYTDARGNKFKWFPDHSAVVFRPQLKDLKDYEPALAASGEQVEAVHLSLADVNDPTGAQPQEQTAMTIAQLRAALGKRAEGKPDDQIETLALSAIGEALSPPPSPLDVSEFRALYPDATKGKADAEVVALAAGEIRQLHVALAAAEGDRDQAMALSGDPAAEPPTRRELAMAAQMTESEIVAAEARNLITPAQATHLRGLANADASLALSEDVGKPSRIGEMIAFAAMSAGSPIPRDPIKRGVPVKPLAALNPSADPEGDALALAADQAAENTLKSSYGHHAPAK